MSEYEHRGMILSWCWDIELRNRPIYLWPYEVTSKFSDGIALNQSKFGFGFINTVAFGSLRN